MEVYILEVSNYLEWSGLTDSYIYNVYSTFEDGKKIIKERLLPHFKECYSETWDGIETEECEDNINEPIEKPYYEVIAFGDSEEKDKENFEIFHFIIKTYTVK